LGVYAMIPTHENAERLTDIMARVERLAFAQEEECNALLLTPSLSLEQVSLTLDLPAAPLTTQPEYIQAEAFLEMSGFFTPSSKRIKSIYTKEKKLREYTDEQGKRRTLKVEIIATHKLGLPITSDLDYYRAFLKICDETVNVDGRFPRMPMVVPTSTIIRYTGKTENARVWREVREWFDRMTLTGFKGAIYRAKKKDFDEGFTGTLFRPTVCLGVTSLVVYTYGCDDGRTALTRCALIDGVLGDRCSQRRACRIPPAAAGSARIVLAAASRPVSTAAPGGFHR
jgi:hypothetical protein